MDNIIEVRDLIRTYNLYPNKSEQIKSILFTNKKYKEFFALNGINFNVRPGESLGLIGINGSGKSTLANIIGGLIPQTSGDIRTRGTISLLSISAGLNNDLTGRENIELKCLMLGLSKKDIKNLEPKIIEFSELGDFIDQPVKNYSSGMKSRLGFSISVSLDPDIFIIDEALSVGDKAFADKCLAKMEEFKSMGKSMIFVSHSIPQMKRFCDRILWLEAGRIKAIGKSKEVLSYYEKFLKFWTSLSSEKKQEYKSIASEVPVYKKISNSKLTLFDFGTTEYNWLEKQDKENKKEQTDKVVTESYVSVLCHLKNHNGKIFKNIFKRDEYITSKQHMRKVYYAKKKIKTSNDTFYLLSSSESFTQNLLGWVSIKNLETLPYVDVSSDKYNVLLNGKGMGLSAPWGGGKEVIFTNLSKFKGSTFEVERTITIGKNVWIYGQIDNGERVWINSKNSNFE